MVTTDWGPIIVAVVLFILLSPGFLFQLPARVRVVEFGNMGTSALAILVHAILYFCILTIVVVAIGGGAPGRFGQVDGEDQRVLGS
uniref:Uncharacterized protein n=1 Tax=Zea mays TaxID=4577 RepID=B6U2D8_MAIZE|nr:hypothetical protein [Zea mays]